jgi:hypothetical protein
VVVELPDEVVGDLIEEIRHLRESLGVRSIELRELFSPLDLLSIDADFVCEAAPVHLLSILVGYLVFLHKC